MEIGLECFDENGQKIFDDEWITTCILGEHETGTAAGSFTDPNIQNRPVWITFAPQIPYEMFGHYYLCQMPVFTVSGNTISWQFKEVSLQGGQQPIYNQRFMYGVYGNEIP